MKTIKAKVHMLPTEPSDTAIVWSFAKRFEPFHLYFTTDEEIKDNDHFMSAFYSYPLQNTKEWREQQKEQSGEYPDLSDLKHHKIIATTDPNISKIGYQSGKLYGVPSIEGTKFEDTRLPVIPQDFIEEYCKAGGIDEVLVEYKEYIKCTNCNLTEEDCECNVSYTQDLIGIDRVKLNPDNTIIIHPVEEKIYSLDDIKQILVDYSNDLLSQKYWGSSADVINKWIEENL